jgi:hypothetical protein
VATLHQLILYYKEAYIEAPTGVALTNRMILLIHCPCISNITPLDTTARALQRLSAIIFVQSCTKSRLHFYQLTSWLVAVLCICCMGVLYSTHTHRGDVENFIFNERAQDAPMSLIKRRNVENPDMYWADKKNRHFFRIELVFRENTTRGTDKARIDIVMVKNLAGSLQDDDIQLAPLCYYINRCCVGQCAACISSWLFSDLKVKWIMPGITLSPYQPVAINFETTSSSRWMDCS